jgi:ribose transport system substrate-binding protein
MRSSRFVATMTAMCALGLGLVACGDDDNGSASGAAKDDAVSAETRAAIEQGFEGVFKLPPSDAPDIEPGKNIWFVPVASSISDFRAKGSIHDTANQVGWKMTECDGKFSPDTQVSCVRQAIADKADGVVLYVIDCANVKAALQDADKAGVPVVSGQGSDCNETDPGEPALFDAATRFQGASSDTPVGYIDFLKNEWARMVALSLVHGTNGKAKILDVYESDLFVTVEQDKGVRKYIKKYCPGCEIVETVEHTGAEIGAPLQQKIEQALARHPEVNAIVNPYDAVTQISMAAVKASGRADEIFNVGCEGEPTVLDAIRQKKGTVDSATALSANWDYFAVLDALNRLFHGEKEPAEGWATGNGTQIIDATHNLQPPGAKFEPAIDFRSAYLEAWGVQ